MKIGSSPHRGTKGDTFFQPSFLLRSSWFSIILSVIVYAISSVAFAFPLAGRQVTTAAAAGASLGVLLSQKIAQSKFRFPFILFVLFCIQILCIGIHHFLTYMGLLASTFNPKAALLWSDMFLWFISAMVLAVGLRTATLRFRFLAASEVAFISLSFAELLAAHRDGAINRPFEISDPIITMGGDPTLVFLWFGAGVALLIVLILIRETSFLRVVLHLSAVVLILLFTLYATTSVGLPQPPVSSNGLGLRSSNNKEKKREYKHQDGRTRRGQKNSQELSFRENYNQSGNRVPLAVVLLHDDYSPPFEAYYFRQNAFSQYNGRRLVQATKADYDRDIIESFPVSYTTMQEVPNLFGDRAILDTTVALLADHKRPFALESPITLQPTTNPDPGRFRRVYRVTSASISSDLFSLFGNQTGDKKWDEEMFNHYTEAPSDPRYLELAKRITSQLQSDLFDDPFARALAIADYLSREGVYSLKSRHANQKDPTAHFLFGDKTGYCVHFAHAAAFLMRSIKIPTRIATGYVVEESARRGGSTIVLMGDNSHAWPEVFLRGIGWVVVDIVPEKTLDPPPQPPDPDLQRLLGEMVRGQRPLPYTGNRSFEHIVNHGHVLLKLSGEFTLYLLLLMLVVFYSVKIWRRMIPFLSPSRSLPRLTYRSVLDRLGEVRIRRHFGESREKFALRIENVSPSFVRLTQLHLRAKFGVKKAVRRSEFSLLTRKIHLEIGGSVPIWRRILGLMIPWSWITSR